MLSQSSGGGAARPCRPVAISEPVDKVILWLSTMAAPGQGARLLVDLLDAEPGAVEAPTAMGNGMVDVDGAPVGHVAGRRHTPPGSRARDVNGQPVRSR
jgi:hypothetical protein